MLLPQGRRCQSGTPAGTCSQVGTLYPCVRGISPKKLATTWRALGRHHGGDGALLEAFHSITFRGTEQNSICGPIRVIGMHLSDGSSSDEINTQSLGTGLYV